MTEQYHQEDIYFNNSDPLILLDFVLFHYELGTFGAIRCAIAPYAGYRVTGYGRLAADVLATGKR
jgi:hypothetical protein